MRGTVVARGIAVSAALLLAACSGGTGSTQSSAPANTATAAVASPSAAGEASAAARASTSVDADLAAVLSSSPVEQEAMLAELSASLERDLWTQTGLEDELGGPAAADAAYAAVSKAIVEQVQALRDDPSFGRFGARLPAADEVSLGGLMFAGWLLAGLGTEAIVSSTNDLKPGETPTPLRSEGDGSTFEASGTLKDVSLTSTLEKTIDGVTGQLRVKVDVAPCPDASGAFTSKVVMEASTTTAGGRTGSNVGMEIAITGRVGDDAELAGYDVTTRTQAAEFKASKGSFVDVTNATTWQGDKVTASDRTTNRSAGGATDELAAKWANMGSVTEALVSTYALKAAEKGWKSGRCVQVEVTTTPEKRTGLAPSTEVSVVAAPKSKIDGGPVGGTVSSSLNGGTSIDPAGTPVAADAAFSYVAPGDKDESATVTLEVKSKRGIGKAEVRFDTKASTGYFIGPITGGRHTTSGLGINSVDDGSSMGTATPADVCDITRPFTLTSPATGGQQTFTPTSASGGTTTYKLTTPITGFKETGKGTYTLELDGDGGTIRTKVRGRLTMPGAPVSYKTTGIQVFELKPATSCS